MFRSLGGHDGTTFERRHARVDLGDLPCPDRSQPLPRLAELRRRCAQMTSAVGVAVSFPGETRIEPADAPEWSFSMSEANGDGNQETQ